MYYILHQFRERAPDISEPLRHCPARASRDGAQVRARGGRRHRWHSRRSVRDRHGRARGVRGYPVRHHPPRARVRGAKSERLVGRHGHFRAPRSGRDRGRARGRRGPVLRHHVLHGRRAGRRRGRAHAVHPLDGHARGGADRAGASAFSRDRRSETRLVAVARLESFTAPPRARPSHDPPRSPPDAFSSRARVSRRSWPRATPRCACAAAAPAPSPRSG
jgi:hypothetical protein